jgi:hypothetical protein
LPRHLFVYQIVYHMGVTGEYYTARFSKVLWHFGGDAGFDAAGFEVTGGSIIDFSVPSNPVHRQTLDTPGHASDVVVDGTLMLIADGVTGIRSVDITDPLNPVALGQLVTGGSARAITKNGAIVYLADWFEGLVVVDVSNPSAPVRLGSALEAGFGNDVILQGIRVWVPTEDGRCFLVDVTSPSAPTVSGGFITGAKVRQAQLMGTLLYLAAEKAGVMIYDVGSPTNPVSTATLPSAGSTNGLYTEVGLLLVADGAGGLRVFDANTRTLLAAVSSANRAVRSAIQDNHLFLASGETGLRVYSLSNPSLPSLVGSVASIGNARDVAVAGSLAVVADGEGRVHVIQVANPSSPVYLGQWLAPDATPIHHVRLVGNRALVAGFTKLWLLDVSNQAVPVVLGSTAMPTRITDIALTEELAAAAAGSEGVFFMNSQNGTLASLGSYNTVGLASSVQLQGNMAWVGDDAAGWIALNITNPASPVLLAAQTTPNAHAGIAVDGRYLAAGTRYNEVVLLDRSDVVQPIESARLSNLTDVLRLNAGGGFLAINQDDAGLAIAALRGTDTDGDGLDNAWEQTLVDFDPLDAFIAIGDIEPNAIGDITP